MTLDFCNLHAVYSPKELQRRLWPFPHSEDAGREKMVIALAAMPANRILKVEWRSLWCMGPLATLLDRGPATFLAQITALDS